MTPGGIDRFALQPWRLSPRSTALRLFLTCWLIYALHFATNIVREVYPALTLGDHLSFDVSEYVGLHPDIFEIKGRGAFINNNPGASMVGALPYALARPFINRVTQVVARRRHANPTATAAAYDSPWPMAQEFYRKARERNLDVKFGLAAAVMQAFAMAPLTAFSAVVMFYILLGLTTSARRALWLALLYAFATPVFYRTAQLNQNLLVSHCGLFAFALLWRPWDVPGAPRRPLYFLSGLLCGWAVVCDYSGLIIVLVLSIYGLVRRAGLPVTARSRTDPWSFAAGVLLSGSVLIGYQWSCFGHPLFPAQRYMPPANFTSSGYAGFAWPHLDLLWATAFDRRFGLFVSAPLLLLALYIPAWFRNRGALIEKRECLCVLALSAAFFVFCSANQYGRMQFNSGVRHIVPVTPFVFLLAAGVLCRLPLLLGAPFAAATTYWSWCLSMYRDVERSSGVFESFAHISLSGFRLPWLTTLERMSTQLPDYFPHGSSPLPLLFLTATVIALLWHIPDANRRAVCDRGSHHNNESSRVG